MGSGTREGTGQPTLICRPFNRNRLPLLPQSQFTLNPDKSLLHGSVLLSENRVGRQTCKQRLAIIASLFCYACHHRSATPIAPQHTILFCTLCHCDTVHSITFNCPPLSLWPFTGVAEESFTPDVSAEGPPETIQPLRQRSQDEQTKQAKHDPPPVANQRPPTPFQYPTKSSIDFERPITVANLQFIVVIGPKTSSGDKIYLRTSSKQDYISLSQKCLRR